MTETAIAGALAANMPVLLWSHGSDAGCGKSYLLTKLVEELASPRAVRRLADSSGLDRSPWDKLLRDELRWDDIRPLAMPPTLVFLNACGSADPACWSADPACGSVDPNLAGYLAVRYLSGWSPAPAGLRPKFYRDLLTKPVGPASCARDLPVDGLASAFDVAPDEVPMPPAAPAHVQPWLVAAAARYRRPLTLDETLRLLSLIMVVLLRAARLHAGQLPPGRLPTTPDVLVRASSRMLRGPDIAGPALACGSAA